MNKSVFFLLICLAGMMATPSEASWAIAIVTGQNPIVVGNDRDSFDKSDEALQSCRDEYHSNKCRILAKGNNSCVALANNGRPGQSIRWTAGQGSRITVARQQAFQLCEAKYPGTCKVVHSFCH